MNARGIHGRVRRIERALLPELPEDDGPDERPSFIGGGIPGLRPTPAALGAAFVRPRSDPAPDDLKSKRREAGVSRHKGP